jgi:hypothetical protein
MRKYTATAPDGTVFKRSTNSRTYSHCVVLRLPAYPGDARWAARPERWSRPEWRRTSQLAEQLAATYRNKGGFVAVHVLDAIEA